MAKRRALDAYFTPKWAAELLTQLVPLRGRVLEPCAGEWAIANVLKQEQHKLHVTTNDIDHLRLAHHHYDAAKPSLWNELEPHEWVVTNPPFNQAFEILKHAFDHATLGVALLLRLSFLEPTKKRAKWLEVHPPDILAVLPRISFTGDGKTDSVTCAWMVWSTVPGAAGAPRIRVVPRLEGAA